MQDSSDLEPSGSSSTAMASSSKLNANELVVKESNEFDYSRLDPKTEALYAFRTITTMLSLIHSTRRTAGNRPNIGRQEKELLQLLDAFAAVLLRNNGVIAVTAQPYDHGSGVVEVLASYFHNEEPLIISQPASATSRILHLLRNSVVTQNPRDLTVKKQEVVDPETSVPNLLKGISDCSKLLTTFLTYTW